MSTYNRAININKAMRAVFAYYIVHFFVNMIINGSSLALTMNRITFFIVGPILFILTTLSFRYRHENVDGSKLNRRIGLVLTLLWIATITIGLYTLLIFSGLKGWEF